MDTRTHRLIQFADNEQPTTAAEESSYYDKQVRKPIGGGHGTIIEERYREGDVLVIKTEKNLRINGSHGEETHVSSKVSRIPACIAFDWIIKQIDDELDPYVEMPWDSCDGWEHKLEELNDSSIPDLKDFKETRGYVAHASRCDRSRVVITDASYCGDSVASRVAYLHNKGASKQVAREVVAADDRRYIDQLVKWYVNGYEEVILSVEITLGGREYSDSCGGFDADDNNYGKEELASDIAYKLNKDGFIVNDYNRAGDYRDSRREASLRNLKHNLNMFNWMD